MSDLTRKLITVQAKLKAPKGQYNSFGKYKYRSCEDILEAVKPLLADAGLLLTIDDEIITVDAVESCAEDAKDAAERISSEKRVYVKATVKVTDGEDVIVTHGYAREPLAKKGMDSSQVTGTSSSYARKYALNGLFLIDDAKDDDTRAPTDKPTRRSAKRAPSGAETPEDDVIAKMRETMRVIGDLKQEAMSMGVLEEGMRSWINSKLKGRPISQASLEDLVDIRDYIAQLIDDEKELRDGDQQSGADGQSDARP